MKKINVLPLLLVFVLPLGLSACGGGGGGGGGDISSSNLTPPGDVLTPSNLVTDKNDIMSYVPAAGTDIYNEGGYTLTVIDDGIKLLDSTGTNVLSGGVVPDWTNTFLYASDFKKDGDFIKASAEVRPPTKLEGMALTMSGLDEGTTYNTLKLVLGGEGVKLTHVDFGLWSTETKMVGTKGGSSAEAVIMQTEPLFFGDSAKATGVSGLTVGEHTFTGNVYAVARDGDGIAQYAEVSGTAILGIDTTYVTTSATLEFDFTDYYKIELSGLVVDSDGTISEGLKPSATITRTPAAPVVALEGDLSINEFNAEMFGADANKASEAVGLFDISAKDTGRIFGAFGVKAPTTP